MNQQQAAPMKPTVAIVGRPNVGKSTLFNRLTGRRQSIVSDIAGTTRDRVMAETEWSEQPFVLVDTGGLDLFPDNVIWKQVSDQIHFAISQCDVITLLVDVSEGITAADRDVADLIRKTGKPTVLAASKSDNDQRKILAVELYELGLGDPIPISAYHNIGLDELMEQILKHFPNQESYLAPEADLKLAIVGRTNVGKSMLLNSITGESRAIVSEISGTTRDPIDTTIVYQDREIQLIDTAGIRRRGSIKQGIERYSVLRSIRAVERCHVAALVLDASEFATSQDTHIASYILETYRGIIIVVNKWDLRHEIGLDKQTMKGRIREKFKFASYAPIVFTSALKTDGVNELLDTALRVQVEWSKGIPRPDIKRTILSAVAENPPPSGGRKVLKLYSAMQDTTMPPSFTFFVNHTDMIHFSYRRYLENKLRQEYTFEGAPIRFRFRGWKR